MSKIVGIGGSGFIGLHISENHARDEYEIAIIDNLNDYSPQLKKQNIENVQKGGDAIFVNADGRVINIGGSNRISINDLSKNLKMIIGTSSEIGYADSQKDDAEHILANAGLAKKLIKNEPIVDIMDGLNKFVNWYKESEKQ